MGDVRIGVAVSDPDGMLASPVETVAAGPNAMRRIVELVAEFDVLECIVGLPLSLSGSEGPAAAKVRVFANDLAAQSPSTPVRLVDERMTTMTANDQLRAAGRKTKATRKVVDQVAATVILQTAIDAERNFGRILGEVVKEKT